MDNLSSPPCNYPTNLPIEARPAAEKILIKSRFAVANCHFGRLTNSTFDFHTSRSAWQIDLRRFALALMMGDAAEFAIAESNAADAVAVELQLGPEIDAKLGC